MLVLLPVLLIVSFMVAYDVGVPLIFWQERPGRKGKRFRVRKFRTMRAPGTTEREKLFQIMKEPRGSVI